MSYIFCFIIVAVAVQSVLSGRAQNVREGYIQPIQLKAGLTAEASALLGEKDGLDRDIYTANDSDQSAIYELVSSGRIACVKGDHDEENYIVVPEKFAVGIQQGYCLRYDWSTFGPLNIKSRNIDVAHVKIVTSQEPWSTTYFRTKHVKIQYNCLEFKSQTPFGDLVLHFADVQPGMFYMEESKNKETVDALSILPLAELKTWYLDQTFTAKFEHLHDILEFVPVLKNVTGKITEFSVIVDGKVPLVINEKTTDEELKQTVVQYATGKDTEVLGLMELLGLKYKFAFKFTSCE